jgi:hypothetical protein
MARLKLELRNGRHELTHSDTHLDGEALLGHFTQQSGPFQGRKWVHVEPGSRFVRYDEVIAVEVVAESDAF